MTARRHRTPVPDHRVGVNGKSDAITPEDGRNYANGQRKISMQFVGGHPSEGAEHQITGRALPFEQQVEGPELDDMGFA